jgi:4-hydroxybutyrate CoA-transferase
MCAWRDYYAERRISGEKAAGMIKSNDTIVTASSAGEPQYLFDKLCERKDELENVKIKQGINIGRAPYCAPGFEGHITLSSFFAGANTREAIADGRGEITSIHYYAQPRAIAEGKVPCDAVFVQCTPPDDFGFVNIGLTCDHMRAAVEKAKLVVAQVNAKYPYVCGDALFHVSEFDYFVEYDQEPYELPLISGDDPVSEKIGYNIATLINDGDCLQMGQGKIPNAILKCLMDKKDLGIHTEVFSDNILPLIEAGVFTGAKKQIDKRKIVATFIHGTRKLYDFIDHNDMIRILPCDYTNAAGVIARNDNVVAINSALEVDLLGQIVADTMNGRPFSGVGGQLDFLRGAEESKGGRPIIALPATAKGGTVSRIVANIPEGHPITSSRQDAHFVVTEYGIAELFGADVKERAKRMTLIAAPEFRADLEERFFAYMKRIGCR